MTSHDTNYELEYKGNLIPILILDYHLNCISQLQNGVILEDNVLRD